MVGDTVISFVCIWVHSDPTDRCALGCPCLEEKNKKNKYICPKICNMCDSSPTLSPLSNQSSEPSVYSCQDNRYNPSCNPMLDTVMKLCAWVRQDPLDRCKLDCPCPERHWKRSKKKCTKTCQMCSKRSLSSSTPSEPTKYNCKYGTNTSLYDPITDLVINPCAWAGMSPAN